MTRLLAFPKWVLRYLKRVLGRKAKTTTATAAQLEAAFRKHGLEPLIIEYQHGDKPRTAWWQPPPRGKQ